MIDHHLPPDPELNRLIQASHEMLQAFATALRSSPDAAAHITTALHQASVDPQDTAMLKAAVDGLFDEGDWFHALPLATRLLEILQQGEQAMGGLIEHQRAGFGRQLPQPLAAPGGLGRQKALKKRLTRRYAVG